MSAIVTVRVPVSDVAKAIEGLHANAAFLEQISTSTKGNGIISHRFVAGDNEIVALDEWDSAEKFQKFFDGNPDVEKVMTEIGMSGPPTVSIYQSIDAPGTI